MKNQLLLVVIISIIFSCKKRDTHTHHIPDYTDEIEAEFPYKDIKKPLVFMNADSSKSKTIIFKSKNIYRLKNSPRDNVSNLIQNFCSIDANAENFSYSVSAENPPEFGHRIVFYNVSTSFGDRLQMAGDNLIFYEKHFDMLLLDHLYKNVYEFYASENTYSKSNKPISRILVNTKNGLLGYYNTDDKDWFYLKP